MGVQTVSRIQFTQLNIVNEAARPRLDFELNKDLDPDISMDLRLSKEFETEMEMESENKTTTTEQQVEEGENVDENDCDDLETGEEEASLPFHEIIEKEFRDLVNEIRTKCVIYEDQSEKVYEKTPTKLTDEVMFIL